MAIGSIDVALALSHGWPEAEWTHNGEPDDLSGITWLDRDIPRPSDDEIRAAWAAYQPPSEADRLERMMLNDPFLRAWVRWQAARDGKTPQRIVDEIRSHA